MWKIQLFELNYDMREVEAVAEVLRSGWITMGEKTKDFEKSFGEFLLEDPIYCTATSSGTAALHMAMMACGVGPGDEVIIPALTFVADINVVKICGATPVLADCTSYEDWNISPKDIRRKINDRTKAVIVVHYAGWPCDMDEILNVLEKVNLERKKRNLPRVLLIEDAAHAPGAKYNGRHCGTIGDIGCFSFFTNKNLSIGEGGMFVTKDKKIDQEARYIRSHGMTSLTLDRHKGRVISYDVVRAGLNYRLDEIRAAIGLVQLEKLSYGNLLRQKLTSEYYRLLYNIKDILIPFRKVSNRLSSYHIFPLLLDSNIDRDKIVQYLKDEGIQASIHYPTFHHFSAYNDMNLNETPIATYISKHQITLPLYPTMKLSNVKTVCNTLIMALR